jgi:hypothetical protein
MEQQQQFSLVLLSMSSHLNANNRPQTVNMFFFFSWIREKKKPLEDLCFSLFLEPLINKRRDLIQLKFKYIDFLPPWRRSQLFTSVAALHFFSLLISHVENVQAPLPFDAPQLHPIRLSTVGEGRRADQCHG